VYETAVDESSPLGRVHCDFTALVDMLRTVQRYSTGSADVRKGPALGVCENVY
jgi:hypothetical protein